METLFTISLLELFIGGGGRLLEVGPVTVRMILFALCLCASLIFAIRYPNKSGGIYLATSLVFLYLLLHGIPLLVGALKGHDLDIMLPEVQQSLYWLAAPFLALVLRSRDMVLRAATLVRVAGTVMAVGYISVVAGLALGQIDYPTLYTTLNDTGEFMFRTESFFFYKGFLYLGIAAIFFLAIPSRFSAACAAVVIIAMVMTLTRGFVLSTIFALLLMLTVQRRWRNLGVALVALWGVAFLVFGYLPSQDESIAISRGSSNDQRIEDFYYIVNNMNVGTLLFGEGFGALINNRINIENTFLWAFWKLGIMGLLFWLLPLVLCLTYFARISRHSPHFMLACAYLFSTIAIYTQTMSNPYLNNPIGLSFVLVAVFSLRTLSKIKHASGNSRHVLESAVQTDERAVL
jgi:O-antigen ligase